MCQYKYSSVYAITISIHCLPIIESSFVKPPPVKR